MSIVRVGLVLVLALAAAVAANIVLLGVASGPKEPVGKLSPRAGLVELPATTTQTRPAPPALAPQTTTKHGSDDGATDSASDD